MTTYAQIFCSINDLLMDPQPPAGDLSALYKEIKAASQTILQEIGEFIPITETKKLAAPKNGDLLFVPPLLALTALEVDGTTITTPSTDVVLKPEQGHWRNGPYTLLEVSDDAVDLSEWSSEQEGNELTGRWGLYEESEDSEADTAAIQAATSDNALTVDNGSKLSPGAVILIGSEQELVTGYDTPSLAVTTTNGAIDETQETITLTNGALVNIGEIIRIDVEQMRVLDISSNTVYVERRWNKTLAATHITASNVDVYRKFTVTRAVNGTTQALHASDSDISRYLVPSDVLFLCKEIATLMISKAATGYAGKSGNADTGTVFYHDAFPRFDLERVRDHYSIKTVR